jgi:XTP/dITP diphosphohydrolase
VKLVMASANPDKVAEIQAILGDAVEIQPRPPDLGDVVEDGETLEDNARLKAVAVCEAAGVGAVADDTGLEVDALGGAPGVHTARFAGEHATYADNVTKMLVDLDGVGEEERGAHFKTVALVHLPDGSEVVAEGVVRGRIALTARGDSGFGYDPIFIPDDGDGRTFAEMSAEEKNALSHRGRAFRALAEKLAERTAPIPPADPPR